MLRLRNIALLLFALATLAGVGNIISQTVVRADDHPANADIDASNNINYGGKVYKPTNWACGSGGGAEDVRNWASDPDCKKHYYINDDTVNDYIVISDNPEDATGALYLDRQGGITGTNVEWSKDITLNGGMSIKDKRARDARAQKRTDAQTALDSNKDRLCKKIEPTNKEGCKTKLQNAFNSCYDQLGGAGGVERDVDQNALDDCMSNTTGYSKQDISDAMIPPLNFDTSQKCSVNGMGWVICQASKLIAKITDGVFVALKELMQVPSLDRNSPGGEELYTVWASIRNIANVIFVILFMIVIFSQLTNAGIDNYGIKRLLPRLLVAIVLVNASYYICALLVDISNVIGGTLKYTLEQFAIPVRLNFDGWNQVASVALVAAGGVALYLNIFALFPIIVSGLIAMFIAVLLLLAREAFIIILIILSPLAFALNTLPNTQKWFERWWSFFFMMLMVYPIIAVVYAGSKIAAGIVSATAPDDSTTQLIFAILALGIQTIPFFIVPLIMKASGGIFERFTGVINDPNKGVFDKMKKRSNEWKDDRNKVRSTNAVLTDSNGLYGQMQKRKARRDYATDYTKKQLKGEALNKYLGQDDVAKQLAEKAALGAAGASHNIPFVDPNKEDSVDNANQAREKVKEQIMNSLRNTNLSVELEEVTAEEAVLDDENYTTKQMEDLAKNGLDKNGNAASEAAQAAAMKKLAATGDIARIHSLLKSLEEMERGKNGMMRRALADGIDKSGASSHAVHLGGSATDALRNGSIFQPDTSMPAAADNVLNRMYANANNNGLYNASSIASQSAHSLEGLRTAMGDGAINTQQSNTIRDTASKVKESSRLTTRMSNSAQRELTRF
jgi:hypothetical protein